MYFFTGLASFTVLAATNSVFAAPTGNDTAAALQRRDYAWCKMKPDVSPEGQISQHFTIEVDSIQDDGLCGGFWANLNGQGNTCGIRLGADCWQTGSVKYFTFWTYPLCLPRLVEGALMAATEPQFHVTCETIA